MSEPLRCLLLPPMRPARTRLGASPAAERRSATDRSAGWLLGALLGLVGTQIGCDGGGEAGPGAAPPLGHPFVPAGYAVTVTRIADDCAVGGLAGVPETSTVRWRQDALSLAGTLVGAGAEVGLNLRARICALQDLDPSGPVDAAAFALQWAMSGRSQVLLDTDRRCRVDALSPPGVAAGAEPFCGSGNRWFLTECGAFAGEATVALTFSAGCDVPRTCQMLLRFVGIPTADHPDAPAGMRLRCTAEEAAALLE